MDNFLMFLWRSAQIRQCNGFCLENVFTNFVWTIMIIEYPMIGFLAMRYFFVHVLNAQIISKLSVAMH